MISHPMTLASVVLTLVVAGAAPAAAGVCDDPEFCSPDNPCWDDVLRSDSCVDIPEVCDVGAGASFEFIDNLDGDNDGQLYVLDDGNRTASCGTLRVTSTGYYDIFDIELSESCDTQQDETGYLTVANSCNTEGWPTEGNAGSRYVVLDNDNTPPCADSSECTPGKVCRTGGGRKCCVPDTPVFMGTFLLVAGEDNKICLNHWCPDWREAQMSGGDPGFELSGCAGSINSIHFRIGATALACEDETTLQECTWGCFNGTCPGDPCDDADCPLFCKDGTCLGEDPCVGLVCQYGCHNGYCLQEPDPNGVDGDMDGYDVLADCDDTNAKVNPGVAEVCNNGIDDNCDNVVDEDACNPGGDDAGAGAGGGNAAGGCCSVHGDAPPSGDLVLLMLVGLLLVRRRRG